MPLSAHTIDVDGDAVPLSVVTASHASRVPALVVVPSIFGVDEGLLEQMEEIAARGAVVIAVDPFWRVSPGPLDHGNPSAAMDRLRDTDLRASYGDFRAALEHARTHERGNGKVVALGICFGGPFCFMAAASGRLDGVVTWHGSRLHDYLERVDEMRCPMWLHFGAIDPIVPLESVEQIRAAFRGRQDVDVVVHPGATHGYTHRGAGVFDAAAERASMDAALAALAGLG